MGPMVQHMHLTPLFAKVRFGLWDAVLAEPAPAEDLIYMRAMRHAARGLAHVGHGRLDDAEQERAALAALRNEASLKTMSVSSVNVASAIVAIADEALGGEIRAAQRRASDALRLFSTAASLEQQGRAADAAAIKTQLDQAWRRADVQLKGGRVRR